MIGPFKTNERTEMYYLNRVWYRSGHPPPYREPLPYDFVETVVEQRGYPRHRGPANDAATDHRCGEYDAAVHRARTKAYGKWREKVSSRTSWGVNVAEWHQTARLLIDAFKVIRRPLSFVSEAATRAAKAKGIRKGSVLLGDLGNGWLKWHFGVEPMIRDVHGLLERLVKPGDWAFVSKTSRETWTRDTERNPWSWEVHQSGLVLIRHSAMSRIKPGSENLALWSDMGLLNPASIAWELVPFSFVVDWFYPIGPYLDSLGDTVGMEFKNGYTTQFEKVDASQIYWDGMINQPGYVPEKESSVRVKRTLGTPNRPIPKLTLPKALSLSRAATSVALLMQILNKGR